jgi:hypothetical protein
MANQAEFVGHRPAAPPADRRCAAERSCRRAAGRASSHLAPSVRSDASQLTLLRHAGDTLHILELPSAR